MIERNVIEDVVFAVLDAMKDTYKPAAVAADLFPFILSAIEDAFAAQENPTDRLKAMLDGAELQALIAEQSKFG